MCVLALAWKAHPRWPVVLAGNRDEFHDRPATPAAPWPDHPVLGGRDLRAGGGWLGTDGRGRLAVLTNVRDPAVPPGGPSRGALVPDFLSAAPAVPAHLEALAAGAPAMAPFNLLCVDRGHAGWLGNHPPARRLLAPGVHTVANAAPGAGWPKEQRLGLALARWIEGPGGELAPLWEALADATQPAQEALPDTGVGREMERFLAPVFIRGRHYGTRASTVVCIAADGSGLLAERRFGPDGVPAGQDTWLFDGQGRFRRQAA